MTATVIIPTTGSRELELSINSVLNQSYYTQLYLVVDGEEYVDKVNSILNRSKLLDHDIKLCVLPQNVGANGFYGHRIYAAFTHLINTDYVLYLDQDCWFEPNHVESLVNTIEQNNIDWSYSLRKIVDSEGNYICNDDCESIGLWAPYAQYNHIDTNCYCIKTSIATKVASVWHGGWGQDRVFFNTLFQHFRNVRCTGEYTVNYRLGGNEGSVKSEFFLLGNKVVEQRYNGVYPWRKI
jgi:glycosyltransferase involved in cell wall biosynthesis